MNTPAAAIAWEIWRKNRLALTIVTALLPVSFLLRAILWPEAVQIFEAFSVTATVVILFWVFSFTETDARGRHSGFPARMFVLPVRTVELVSYPVLYGTLSVLLFYFAWVGAISAQWNLNLPRQTILCEASLPAAMMVSIQAGVWALHRFNWTRMIVLTAGATLAGCFISFSLAGELWVSRKQLTMGALAVLAIAYGVAVVAVERDRRGNWLKWLERFYQGIFDALPWRRKMFASPRQAQFWIEWNRRGWFMVCVLSLGMAVGLVLIPLSAALYLDSTLTLINFSTLPIFMLWFAGISGMHLGRSDAWSPEVTLHPITATRPITTGEVVVAKLRVAALVTVLGWIGFELLAFPAIQTVRLYDYFNGDIRQFWSTFPEQHRILVRWVGNPVVVLTALGLTWHGIVQGMCPVLLGRPRKQFWEVALAMTFFGGAVLIAGWLYRHPQSMPGFLVLLPWLTAAKLIWKWGATARAFAGAYHSHLYSQTQWRIVLAFWVLLTFGVAVSAGLACAAHSIPSSIVLFLAVCLLPAGELPTCASNLAQNRHR